MISNSSKNHSLQAKIEHESENYSYLNSADKDFIKEIIENEAVFNKNEANQIKE